MKATELLMEEHEIIRGALAVLRDMARAAESGSPPPEPSLRRLLGFLSGFADEYHHAKEERLLFPALEQAGLPVHGGPVGVMLHEHEQGRALLRAMTGAAGRLGSDEGRREFANAADLYVQLLDQHIEKENQILFMMADRLIRADRARELDEQFDRAESEASPLRDALLRELEELV
jgi:hemerythrin-like domain-containing protein